MTATPSVWLLLDDRAGNVNQLLGVAEALKWPFLKVDLEYNSWVKLPNFLRKSFFLGVKNKENILKSPWPDVVLVAGRRAFPMALEIKKRSGWHTKIVQIMNPGFYGRSKADLLVIPQHDDLKNIPKNGMLIDMAPHRITQEKLESEYKKWYKAFEELPSPKVALIVGGSTKDKVFTQSMAKKMLTHTLNLQPKSLLVTTSRRTPPEVVQYLKESIRIPHYFYQFGDKKENPYFGFLSCADTLVVTGDSISMCSECVATGKKVFVFSAQDMISKKHRRFLENLFQKGFAFPLGFYEPQKQAKAINTSEQIAHRIKQWFI